MSTPFIDQHYGLPALIIPRLSSDKVPQLIPDYLTFLEVNPSDLGTFVECAARQDGLQSAVHVRSRTQGELEISS